MEGETPKIKEGKPVTTEAGRQGRPEKKGGKREKTMVDISMITVDFNSD